MHLKCNAVAVEVNKMAGGANPAATQAAANPYQQAAGAQQAAIGRTAMGLNQTAAGGMGAYANPYETQVVQQSLADVGRQAQMGFNQLGAQAQSAGAFGGSRHGIAQAEMGKGYTQQMANTAAQMRQQGFNTALGASQADLQRQLGAAGQLAGLGQQSFGYGQAIQQQQMLQGAMQQAAMQSLIDAAKGQYAGYTGAPQQGLNTLLSSVYGVQPIQGGTSSMQPGLFNYMQTAAMAAGGMR
jgi:hypothetical protein